MGVQKDKIDEIRKADGRIAEMKIKTNWLKCVSCNETIKMNLSRWISIEIVQTRVLFASIEDNQI